MPASALHLVPGDGRIGAALVAHPDIAGVVFTGSTEVARSINRALAAKDGPIVPLIAETGGINAMIVDATALPEQVADDVVTSAFRSAGQRCSALRLLFVPERVVVLTTALLGDRVDLGLRPVDDLVDVALALPVAHLHDAGARLDEPAQHGPLVDDLGVEPAFAAVGTDWMSWWR